MQTMVTLHAISEMFGVDRNHDGVLDALFPPGDELGRPATGGFVEGIKVYAGRWGDGMEAHQEARCGVVFDLASVATNAAFRIVSAQLFLQVIDRFGDAHYEVHGFRDTPTVTLDALDTYHGVLRQDRSRYR